MKSFTISKSTKMSNECGATLEVEEIEQDFQYEINEEEGTDFEIEYCVSFRDTSLPEWILARWYWNNLWIWIDDATWFDRPNQI